jgi:hypothetical protein
LKSKPTWSNTSGCSAASAFFIGLDPVMKMELLIMLVLTRNSPSRRNEMREVMLRVLAAVIGCVLGVLFFSVMDFSIQPLIGDGEWGVWTEYGAVALGGFGAICGMVIGKAVAFRVNKPRRQLPEPANIPRADVTVQARRNCRPLTWLYRV